MAYPTSLDELTDGVPSDGAAATTALDNVTYPHDDHHRALAVAVEAVEAELGTDPSGASATVAARFTAAETSVSDHLSDTVDAHDASAISFSPVGTVAATDVQAAIAEVAAEKALLAHASQHAGAGSDPITSLGAVSFTGAVGFADGSAAAPAVSFASDTDTGVYRIAANELGIATGGTLRATVNSTGLSVTGSLTTGAGGIVGQVYTSDAATGTNAAGYGSSGVESTYLGYLAGVGASGGYCASVGRAALYGNSALAGVAVGYTAGFNNTGASIVAVGSGAGLNNTYNAVVLLGRDTVATGSSQFVVGATAVPINTWIPGHDTDTYLDIATANTWKVYAGGQKGIEVNATGGAPYLGFFGTAAVAKPTGVAVSAAGIHAALVTLGLIAA